MQSPSEYNRVRKLYEMDWETPPVPVIELIDNFNLPKKDQKFRPPVIPANFDNIPKDEQMKFLKRELDRRINGYWFYNNGNIEYMTGSHYFYCAYWKIDVPGGYPQWRDSDRDFFYFWELCKNDPKCLGALWIARRRTGKTWITTSIVYGETTLKDDSFAGIQSKTNKDAGDVFRKLISAWKKLPAFFKPTDSGETNPKTSLNFTEPSTRNTKGVRKTYKNVLNSGIDYGATVASFYDGRALYRYYLDEFGKITELSAYDLWQIVKECLVAGAKIRGKALLTTTVEEMEKAGGKYAKMLWEDSNPRETNKLGRTKSGLYRYFAPAYMGFDEFIDEYGYSDIEGAKEYLRAARSELSGIALASERRKFPFVVEEAFRVDKDAVFDSTSIYTQIEYNDTMPEKLRQGNLVWVEKDKSVRFMDSTNGRWKIYQLPRPEEVNKITVMNGALSPCNNKTFVSGVDPFDQSKTFHDKRSDAASYVFRMLDPFEPIGSNCFVAQYVARPPTADMFFEDMIMQCVYYGCTILAESNRPGLLEHFRRRGFSNFLMNRPGGVAGEKGIPMSGSSSRELLLRVITNYVYDYVGWIHEEDRNGEMFFNDLLHEWINFEADNWTPYDMTVASGLTLIAAMSHTIKAERNEEKRRKNVINFPTFRVQGRRY